MHHKLDIIHGLIVGLHEIFSNGNGKIWFSATAVDAALEFDISGTPDHKKFTRLIY
jgi:hypothetical protein